MINILRFEKDKIIEENIMKHIRKVFRLEKENKATKDRIIRNIRHLFMNEEEDYNKPVREGNFWSNNYIEYESNGDRNKTPSVEEYLKKIKPCIKDIINDLK